MKYQIALNLKFNLDEAKTSLFNILIDDKILDSYNPIGIMPSIKTKNIINFFENVINEKDYSEMEYSWVIFGEDKNDEGEIVIPKNMVGFSIFDDRTIISKVDFFQLCLQMAEKAIEAVNVFKLKEEKIINEEWIANIKDVIPLLQKKIKTLI